MKAALLVTGVTVGCVTPAEPAELATPGSCVDPTSVSYGAVADDGLDDRVAMQAAIDAANAAGLDVCVPAGVFDLTIAPSDIWSLHFSDADGMTFAGSGAATVLKFMHGTENSMRAWRFLNIDNGTTSFVLRDFTIQGNSAAIESNLDQTFGINVGDGSGAEPSTAHISIRNLDIVDTAGDAIRILGDSDGAPVTEDVEISHNRIADAHRSGIAIQRGTRLIRFVDNVVAGTDKADVDLEASSPDPAAAEHSLLFSGNVFIRDASYCDSIELNGTSAQLGEPGSSHHIVFSGNLILGGAVFLQRTEDVVFRDNVVIGAAAGLCSASPVLILAGAVQDVALGGNVVIQPSSAGAAEVLRVINDCVVDMPDHCASYIVPHRLVATGETYIQHTDEAVVGVSSLDELILSSSMLHSFGTTAPGIRLRSGFQAIRGATIARNRVLTDTTASEAIKVGSDSSDVDGIVIVGNVAATATNGVGLGVSTGGYLSPPVIGGNSWGAGGVNASGTVYEIGGTGDRAWSVGNGTPAAACTRGALYTNTANGRLHVCEDVSGTPTWTLK